MKRVADLDASQQRNDNRSVFRSRLLLDQDRAVGSANLASIYRDLGMTEVSVREAARAVTEDYANASAHLFLADSYYNLLDPTQFNLRYDTVQANEFLLANILSPVGGGRLSQQVSQQDYSKLFTSRRLGHRQFHRGAHGRDAPSAGLPIRHLRGHLLRAGPGLSPQQRRARQQRAWITSQWNTTIKQQITPQDTAMIVGALRGLSVPATTSSTITRPMRGRITNSPNNSSRTLVSAWHHEWSPGMNTLLLVGPAGGRSDFQ